MSGKSKRVREGKRIKRDWEGIEKGKWDRWCCETSNDMSPCLITSVPINVWLFIGNICEHELGIYGPWGVREGEGIGTILCAERWCCLSSLLGYWVQS